MCILYERNESLIRYTPSPKRRIADFILIVVEKLVHIFGYEHPRNVFWILYRHKQMKRVGSGRDLEKIPNRGGALIARRGVNARLISFNERASNLFSRTAPIYI